MKTRVLFSAALAVLCWPVSGTSQQDKVYAINIRVFEIPAFQSVTWAGPDKDGNIVGTQIGGNVTAKFPAQPVFIPTGLGPSATEEEMKTIFYDRGYLPRDCMPGGTSWSLAGFYSICCPEQDLGTDRARTEYHEPPVAPSRENRYVGRQEYWLTILPLSADSQEIALHLEFTGATEPTEGDLGGAKVLLHQEIKGSLGKILLLGFPQYAKAERMANPRGTVYVLAMLAQLQHARRCFPHRLCRGG